MSTEKVKKRLLGPIPPVNVPGVYGIPSLIFSPLGGCCLHPSISRRSIFNDTMEEQRRRTELAFDRSRSTELQQRAKEIQSILRQIHDNKARRSHLGSSSSATPGSTANSVGKDETGSKNSLSQENKEEREQKNKEQLEASIVTNTATANDFHSSNSYNNSKKCSFCQKNSSLNLKLLRCSQCQSTWYCNRECQMKHWKIHRTACQKIKNKGNIDHAPQQRQRIEKNNGQSKLLSPSDDSLTNTSSANNEEMNYWISSIASSSTNNVPESSSIDNYGIETISQISRASASPSSFFLWNREETTTLLSSQLQSLENELHSLRHIT